MTFNTDPDATVIFCALGATNTPSAFIPVPLMATLPEIFKFAVEILTALLAEPALPLAKPLKVMLCPASTVMLWLVFSMLTPMLLPVPLSVKLPLVTINEPDPVCPKLTPTPVAVPLIAMPVPLVVSAGKLTPVKPAPLILIGPSDPESRLPPANRTPAPAGAVPLILIVPLLVCCKLVLSTIALLLLLTPLIDKFPATLVARVLMLRPTALVELPFKVKL